MTERKLNLSDTRLCNVSCNISHYTELLVLSLSISVTDEAITSNYTLMAADIYQYAGSNCEIRSIWLGDSEHDTLSNALNEVYTSRSIKRYPQVVTAIKNAIADEINSRMNDLMALSAEIEKE